MDSPFGGRPALGCSPAAATIVARVMKDVSGAGMDGGTLYEGNEGNRKTWGVCLDALSAEKRKKYEKQSDKAVSKRQISACEFIKSFKMYVEYLQNCTSGK